MNDRIPSTHDLDIVDALDLSYQHYMDTTDDCNQSAADFERDEAITIKRAMNEISRLRAKLERAREGVAELNRFAKERKFDTGYLASNPPQNPVAYELGWRTKELLRELENGGGE